MPRRKTTGLSSALRAHETFYGRVETTDDALRIIEACSSGILSRAQRRLNPDECTLIRPGSVYVFDELESGIKRWTDGKVWSPSRILGNFLVYRELERKIGRRAGGGPNCSGLPKELRNSGLQIIGSTKGTFIVKGAGGLLKKTFSAKVGRSTTHLVIYLPNETDLVEELPPVSSYSELKDVPIRKEFLQAQKFRRPPPGSVRNRGASNRRKRKSRRRQETDSEADEEEEDEDDEESLESEGDVQYEEEENDKDNNEDIMVKDENVNAEGTEEKEDEDASIAATDEEEEAAYSHAKVDLDTRHKRKRTKAATDTESEEEEQQWTGSKLRSERLSSEEAETDYEDQSIDQTNAPTDNKDEEEAADISSDDDTNVVEWCRRHTPPFLPTPPSPTTSPRFMFLLENYEDDGAELCFPEVYDKEESGYLEETDMSDCLSDDPTFFLEYFCNRSPNLSPHHDPDANSVASGQLDQVLKSSGRNENVDMEGCRKIEEVTLTPPPSSPSGWSCGGDLFEYHYSPRRMLVKRE